MIDDYRDIFVNFDIMSNKYILNRVKVLMKGFNNLKKSYRL